MHHRIEEKRISRKEGWMVVHECGVLRRGGYGMSREEGVCSVCVLRKVGMNEHKERPPTCPSVRLVHPRHYPAETTFSTSALGRSSSVVFSLRVAWQKTCSRRNPCPNGRGCLLG